MNKTAAVTVAAALAIVTAIIVLWLVSRPIEIASNAMPGLDDLPTTVEFRFLADTKHDQKAADKAEEPESIEHPPAGYRWIWLGRAVTGSDAQIASTRLTAPGVHWEAGEFAGGTLHLSGTNLAGSDLSKDFDILHNTALSLQLGGDPTLFFKSVSSYRIDLTPSRVGLSPSDDAIIREVPDGPGRVKRLILVKLDRHNVTNKDFTRVAADVDERLKPAIRFEFSRAAARRFGALTREHLPEDNGTFKYRLGIILDGHLISAPVVLSEIRDSGIIEGGAQGFKPKEVEHLIAVLRSSIGK